MKNYLILFGLLFSIFIIPSDVLAADNSIYFTYYNSLENFDVLNDGGEVIKNKLYSMLPTDEKESNDKCFVNFFDDKLYTFVLGCSSSFSDSYINIHYNGFYDNLNYFFSSITDVRYYSFSSDYSYLEKINSFSITNSTKGLVNTLLYSDFNIKFSKINAAYSNVVLYDSLDSDIIYGTFDVDGIYSYKDFYLTDYNGSSDEEVVVFQDNDIHNISKLILGNNIPEEYSFVYTISDYLIVLIFVGIIISPISIIIKVLRW